jgi:nucleoside-diphosphate-sugar epimerase
MDHGRRAFLQGLAATGATPRVLLGAGGAGVTDHDVLVVGPATPLAREILASLGVGYRGRHAVQPDSAAGLLRGARAVVVLPTRGHPATLADQIDDCTRSVYELLQAAVSAQVRQVVYLSTLAMMDAYDASLQVDEEWRPRPGDSDSLPLDLGEFVCREFAREGKLDVVVLRLGEFVAADAVEAVRRTLDAQLADGGPRLGSWSVVHIHSGSTPRFPLNKAARLLGYRPRTRGTPR